MTPDAARHDPGMELIENDGATMAIRLSREEAKTLNNALNEILNGPEAISDWEFETRVGVSQDEAEGAARGTQPASGLNGAGLGQCSGTTAERSSMRNAWWRP